MTWGPAPEGPPNLNKGSGKYYELYLWLNAHPGEWAMIPNVIVGLATSMRKRGYQARVVTNREDRSRGDVYVRNPLS